jgi:hypothetical protein
MLSLRSSRHVKIGCSHAKFYKPSSLSSLSQREQQIAFSAIPLTRDLSYKVSSRSDEVLFAHSTTFNAGETAALRVGIQNIILKTHSRQEVQQNKFFAPRYSPRIWALEWASEVKRMLFEYLKVLKTGELNSPRLPYDSTIFSILKPSLDASHTGKPSSSCSRDALCLCPLAARGKQQPRPTGGSVYSGSRWDNKLPFFLIHVANCERH